MRRGWAGLLVTLALAACGGPAPGGGGVSPAYPYDAGAVTVVAAENFYGDVLHQIGGSKLRIFVVLSDPNADPHQYESNASTARAVADAQLVVENGLGYDAFIDRLVRASPSAARTVLSAQALADAPAGANPHLWYDPAVMPRVAQAAADALVRIDAANAALYRANLQAVLTALGEVQARVAALRPALVGTPVAFTEPVFGYMAAALGLEVRSPDAFVRAVAEGNDPAPEAVAAEQNLITRHEVKALIYNIQTVTRTTTRIRDLAQQSGIPVVGVFEMQPAGSSFQQWQLDTLARVAQALGAA